MISDRNKLYWGDAHTNIHTKHFGQLSDSFAAARDLLDFWPVAYYPFLVEDLNGFMQETTAQRPVFLESWKTICEMTRARNEPGRFVCFPGYEWHGDRRRWGDHNVFYPCDDAPLDDVADLPDLYNHIRAYDGIAIPHHTGYEPLERGKDWSVMDERLSPFVEIYSIHGSSEGYGGPFHLDRNVGMGPLAQSGSAQAGLARGWHFGFSGSGDIHTGYPIEWHCGLMACYAPELTREAVWDAFHRRRVYAVSGDRIKLDFSVAGTDMGGIGRARPPYRIVVRTEGTDGIERIELLRNNILIGSRTVGYDASRTFSAAARHKVRAIFGWGPRGFKHKDAVDRVWDVDVSVEGGALLGIEKHWMRFGQQIVSQNASGCKLRLTSVVSGTTPGARTHPFPGVTFDIRGDSSTRVRMNAAGLPITFTLGEARRFPAVFADLNHANAYLREKTGLTAESMRASSHDLSSIWHTAYKTQVWPAVHESEFAVTAEFEDAPDRAGESWYYCRVIQNNGQVAWSSPVWVTPEG